MERRLVMLWATQALLSLLAACTTTDSRMILLPENRDQLATVSRYDYANIGLRGAPESRIAIELAEPQKIHERICGYVRTDPHAADAGTAVCVAIADIDHVALTRYRQSVTQALTVVAMLPAIVVVCPEQELVRCPWEPQPRE
jgi:hypothetical protein